jgi:hypothetical protein
MSLKLVIIEGILLVIPFIMGIAVGRWMERRILETSQIHQQDAFSSSKRSWNSLALCRDLSGGTYTRTPDRRTYICAFLPWCHPADTIQWARMERKKTIGPLDRWWSTVSIILTR